MRISISIMLIGLVQVLYCQYGFLPGVIITKNLDTIVGNIENNSFERNSEVCVFKSAIEREKKVFNPDQLHSYLFNTGKYYISKNIILNGENLSVFLEYVIKGKLNIYYLRNNSGDYYFAEKEGDTLVYLDNSLIYYRYDEVNGKWIISEDETIQKVRQSDRYKGTLTYLMSETPELHGKNSTISNLNHKVLIDISKEYHYSVCNDEECIVFEKKTHPKKAVGLIYGYMLNSYKNPIIPGEHYTSNHVNQFGLFFSSQLLGLNENLYFKSFVLYDVMNDFSYEDKDTLHFSMKRFSVPISLEYMIPTKIVNPYLGLGVGLHASTINFRTETPYGSQSETIKERGLSIALTIGVSYSYKRVDFNLGAYYYHYLTQANSSVLFFGLGIGYNFY